jgi:hypothetical protein
MVKKIYYGQRWKRLSMWAIRWCGCAREIDWGFLDRRFASGCSPHSSLAGGHRSERGRHPTLGLGLLECGDLRLGEQDAVLRPPLPRAPSVFGFGRTNGIIDPWIVNSSSSP